MVIFRFKGVKRLNPLQGIWHLLADKLIRVANIYQHAGDFSTCLWATSLWPYFTFFIFSSKNSAFLLYIYILKGVLVKSMNHDWNPLKSQIFQVTLWIFSEIHWNPEFSIEIPNFPGQFVEKKPMILAASVHLFQIGGRQPRRLSQCLGGVNSHLESKN